MNKGTEMTHAHMHAHTDRETLRQSDWMRHLAGASKTDETNTNTSKPKGLEKISPLFSNFVAGVEGVLQVWRKCSSLQSSVASFRVLASVRRRNGGGAKTRQVFQQRRLLFYLTFCVGPYCNCFVPSSQQ